MPAWLRRLRVYAQRVSALLLLIVAGRFTFTAAGTLLAGETSLVSTVAREPLELPSSWDSKQLARLQKELDTMLNGAAGAASTPTPLEGAQQEKQPPKGELITVTLTVTAGGDRSAVFVDGAPVGHTVFVGDVACQLDRDVSIRVVGKNGSSLESVQRCTGAPLLISD